MKIYLKSAGKSQDFDYHWLNEADSTMPSELISWHGKLADQDKVFALVSGHSHNGWHVVFRNLILPGVTDNRGRQILLNVCFSELGREDEVRALALAYLDFELKKKKSGRPIGRYQPELAAAYEPTAEGDYQYNTQDAMSWASKAIDKYRRDLGYRQASCRLKRTLNPSSSSDLDNLKGYLKGTKLSEEEGIRLLWSDFCSENAPSADIVLTYTKELPDNVSVYPAPQLPKDKPMEEPVAPLAPVPPPVDDREKVRYTSATNIAMFAIGVAIGFLCGYCIPEKIKLEDSQIPESIVSPESVVKIEPGKHYVGVKDLKTGKVLLRPETPKEKAVREARDKIVDKLNPL